MAEPLCAVAPFSCKRRASPFLLSLPGKKTYLFLSRVACLSICPILVLCLSLCDVYYKAELRYALLFLDQRMHMHVFPVYVFL